MPSVEVSERNPSQAADRPPAAAVPPGDHDWAQLREATAEGLVLSGDPEYEAARRVWNGSVDRHPAALVRCRGIDDVRASIRFARERNLLLAVRGGGHSLPGHSVCDGGLVIDLSGLRGVDVDPQLGIARAEPGATWGDFDAATERHDLMTTGGQVTTTGIAGLTLGGGLGYLMRQHGLTCDNLIGAELVTAEGDLVRASAEENPDLLWGLQGGGGNFGVVTALEYRVHPATPVFGGFLVHDASQAGRVLRFWRDFIADTPDSVFSEAVLFTAPAEPPYPEAIQGKAVVSVSAFAFGDPEYSEELLRPLMEFGPPVSALMWPMSYTNVQSIFTAPAGRLRYEKSDFLNGLPDEAIDALAAAASATSDPMSQLVLVQLGGAMGRVDPMATAFCHRSAAFFFTASTSWTDGDDDRDRLRAAYGPRTYSRLAELKHAWDPGNVFRLNQNIQPAKETEHG